MAEEFAAKKAAEKCALEEQLAAIQKKEATVKKTVEVTSTWRDFGLQLHGGQLICVDLSL